MNDKSILLNKVSLIGWGLLLIWWGLRWSVLAALPNGSGLIGTSLILFGANAYRKSIGLPALTDNTFLGVVSLLIGGTLFIFDVLNTAFQPPVFETILICLGTVLIAYAIRGSSNQKLNES